jgi:hypothetical protein
LKADKRVKILQRDFRQAQAELDARREEIDTAAKEEVAAFAPDRYEVRMTRHFVIKVIGS